MVDYVIIAGKKYRKGYTTGSCAAAAAKAAAYMLISRKVLDTVEIDTPAGIRLKLTVNDVEIAENYAICSIIKDGGDDPDVTTGLKIFAKATLCKSPGIFIIAGEGIGRVTLPGLKVPVGQPAINPVPMKMIKKEVGEVLPQGMGVEIKFSIPGGYEVAEKTYNPKLGIEGGISILGTSGIVVPMSEEAWKESLALDLSMLAAKGCKKVVFIFGNYGENFATGKLPLNNNYIVKISNFAGYMLDKAVEYGFEKLIISGHPGKLVKVAAGIFHTHSRVADARMEIMAAYSALEGASQQLVNSIYQCKTTEAAMDIINKNGLQGVYRRIVENVARRCTDYTFNKIRVGAVIFDGSDNLLAMDKVAEELINEFK
ncbi:cobalt-precorrin-5B (C(1))-methyltransferase CbiD [Lutispora thermophila]|uniref:Cobalt-precorrin-5B C(1)-methyltransferase n=1 Tax=Lutispora thermophila DSM 19022 TaxID=1122184 RepID=A0A1M6D339_9FIRM|nr:cobalt-precorrin-5B (C(1))-methyltransferase CbiD [Lutispora thermophila]SHI67715.1 cobalt-precorrin 5B C1-methyltransferase [Lutispora thermophila DSM 19022]